jgi:hypothetical protein
VLRFEQHNPGPRRGANVLYTILVILLIIFLALIIWRMVAGRRAL